MSNMKTYKTIAISRQFGSAGRTIGRAVAEQLGIPCYDQELIEMFAKESGFTVEYIKESSEEAESGFFAFLHKSRVFDTPVTQDWLWEDQCKVINQLADQGPCVIVGRCADHILREREDCLRVYIHADAEKRAKRIVEVYGEREDSPEKRVKDKDKRRAAYYKKYTKEEWGDADNYQIALDSGELGIDTCISLMKALYKGEVK